MRKLYELIPLPPQLGDRRLCSKTRFLRQVATLEKKKENLRRHCLPDRRHPALRPHHSNNTPPDDRVSPSQLMSTQTTIPSHTWTPPDLVVATPTVILSQLEQILRHQTSRCGFVPQ